MIKMPHLPVMEWNFEDQLHVTEKQVVNNGNTAERTYYVYDAAGERIRKVTERQNGTRKDERLYLGGFEIYCDYNGNGTAIKLDRETLHIMDDTRRIAMVETKIIDTHNDPSPTQLIRYQFSNHLGSASLELENDGKVISYEEYYPYGSTSYQAVDKSIKAAAKRYRYTGKERDEETGLYYHGARYYAPWLGRWTATDQRGLLDGVNVYQYANSSPIIFVDLTGNQASTNEDTETKIESTDAQVEFNITAINNIVYELSMLQQELQENEKEAIGRMEILEECDMIYFPPDPTEDYYEYYDYDSGTCDPG